MAMEVIIQSNISAIKGDVKAAVSQALEIIGMQAESNLVTEVDNAVYSTPKSPRYRRTGNLRGANHYEVSGDDTVLIKNGMEYAGYVEYGTSKMPARPFFKPAILNYLDEYKGILEDCLSNA